MMENLHTDLLIVGGGLIGRGIAYEALRRGRKVTLLSEARAGEAVQAAAGMLAPVSEAEPILAPLTQLGLDSLARYPKFVEDLERLTNAPVDYQPHGAILVATSADHRSLLTHLYEAQRALDLQAEWLDADRLRTLEPHLSPRVMSGVSVPGDHHIDPRALYQSLGQAIAHYDGRSVPGRAVAPRLKDDRIYGVLAETPQGKLTLDARQVVLTAGAWSSEVFAELVPLPLRPIKGQILRLAGERLLNRVLRTPDVYLVPRSSGELWVGASTEDVGFDPDPTAGVIMDLLWQTRRALPGVTELTFVEARSGFRPALRDHLPAIGATHVPGLFVATGHYRNGVLLLPSTAHHLVNALEQAPPAVLTPFLPTRFHEGDRASEKIAR